MNLINVNFYLNCEIFYSEATKPRKVFFDESLNRYSNIIYLNNIPLFFNLNNNWFFYDLIAINDIKSKFLILFC